MRTRIVCAVALAVAILSTEASSAPDPRVVQPTAPFLGKSYGEWSAAWWQWAFSFPSEHDPLTDTADCSAGQGGKVWFLGVLGGTAFPTVTLSEAKASYIRQCTVPRDTWLFFPLINSEQSAIESCYWGGSGGSSRSAGACNPTFANLQTDAKGFQDLWQDMSVDVDGLPIAQVDPTTGAPFRVQSPEFTLGPLPANNSLKASSDIPNTAGKTTASAADGAYIMLKPLSPGLHTIHLRGGFLALSLFRFTLDVTYHITVAPRDACTARKVKAIAAKESGLLGCAAQATAKGSSAKLAACEAKVMARFDTAFGTAGSCAGDVTSCENSADACRSSVVAVFTDTLPSSCEAQKQKAAGNLAKAELGCDAKAAATGLPVDPACLSKAADHFTKALTKAGTCPDGGAPQAEIETTCVQAAVTTNEGGLVTGVCPINTTTTSTTTTTTTTTTSLPCDLSNYPTCGGSCPTGQTCTANPLVGGICSCQ